MIYCAAVEGQERIRSNRKFICLTVGGRISLFGVVICRNRDEPSHGEVTVVTICVKLKQNKENAAIKLLLGTNMDEFRCRCEQFNIFDLKVDQVMLDAEKSRS
jgi:hypothetical protein